VTADVAVLSAGAAPESVDRLLPERHERADFGIFDLVPKRMISYIGNGSSCGFAIANH
jgi:hypothetical protein